MFTPLHFACSKGNLRVVEELVNCPVVSIEVLFCLWYVWRGPRSAMRDLVLVLEISYHNQPYKISLDSSEISPKRDGNPMESKHI